MYRRAPNIFAAGRQIYLALYPIPPQPSLIKTRSKNRESRRYFFSRVLKTCGRAHARTHACALHPTEE